MELLKQAMTEFCRARHQAPEEHPQITATEITADGME
jgi:hypothetical protein